MRALWFENGRADLRDVTPPRPAPGEALVEVLTAGICNTDLELLAGYKDFVGIPGHEFVGRVVEGPADLEGARVAADINLACGDCPSCRRRVPEHCERREIVGISGRPGAFAERIALPVEALHRVAEDIDDERAVFAEPLAAALRVRRQVDFAAGQQVLVLGAGKLGQLIARVLASTGCDLAVATRRPEAAALLAAHGITSLPSGTLPDRAFDVVVECTGAAAGFDLARRAVRPRGTLILKSTFAGAHDLPAAELVVDEITLVGSRCGSVAEALDELARGFAVEDLVDCRYPLERAPEALAQAARPGVLKVLLRPQPS